jgi:hypothetical protein
MKISDFVTGRSVEKQAVYRYLTRHPNLMEKCQKDGKELDLPDDVVAALDAQYPLSKPVVIINGLPPEDERALRQQLQTAQDALLRMQQELTETKLQLAAKEQTELLLTMKDDKIEALSTEIKNLKERNLWERIRNKS